MKSIVIAIGVICLAYAGFLFNKKDQNYMYVAPVGAVVLLFGLFGYDQVVKNDIESVREGFEALENFNSQMKALSSTLDRLGVGVPTSTEIGQCYDIKTKTLPDGTTASSGSEYIMKVKEQLNTLLSSLTTEYKKLSDSSGVSHEIWNALTDGERIKITQDYDNIFGNITNMNASITSRKIGNNDIYSYNGIYSCDSICTAEGKDGIMPLTDSATYTEGGICSCPPGYYPQPLNGFVKCYQIDTGVANTINSSITSRNTDYSTAISNITSNKTSLSYKCLGQINNSCPVDISIRSAPTSAPTTVRPTTQATTVRPTTQATTVRPTTQAPAPTTQATTSASAISNIRDAFNVENKLPSNTSLTPGIVDSDRYAYSIRFSINTNILRPTKAKISFSTIPSSFITAISYNSTGTGGIGPYIWWGVTSSATGNTITIDLPSNLGTEIGIRFITGNYTSNTGPPPTSLALIVTDVSVSL